VIPRFVNIEKMGQLIRVKCFETSLDFVEKAFSLSQKPSSVAGTTPLLSFQTKSFA